ncbi:MAG TPA: L-threonylcarbamoyladenylate synthase [Pyrinomonadaceae bacterium]|nr:L-threonylcarbamoyladenylate synthase [Pyrinomonadaceae bacterium]
MPVHPDNTETRERAGRLVKAGGVVIFRTDTFYGVGADPFNVDAVASVNELKGRDGKPILCLINEATNAARLIANRTRAFDLLAAAHWPGALTLVAEARAELPELLTAGTGTVGIRLPDDREARAVVQACGGVLTATSANPAGQAPARNAAEAARYFPDLFIIGGGDARTDLPSTVVDVSTERPRLIREGVVTRAEIEKTLRAEGIEL